MSVPACDDADDDPGPAGPPGTETAVRQALITAAESCALAVAELLDRPDSDAALEMARLTVTVLDRLGEAARGRAVAEAVQAEKERRAFRDGYEACKAARCRLQAVPGGGAG